MEETIGGKNQVSLKEILFAVQKKADAIKEILNVTCPNEETAEMITDEVDSLILIAGGIHDDLNRIENILSKLK